MSNPPPSFLESTRNKIKQQGWKRLLLAVSGGLDSTCLAHYFICNQKALGIEWIGIAHVHHGLREGSADLDAELVEQFAKDQGVPFFRKNLDGRALKNADGSLEENARKARYDALNEYASRNRADAIVTAHHAGDQAETMYMRLRRGVTLAGLSGIRETREGTPSVYRPLLNVTHKDLLQYATENGLQWREDESNSDEKFLRNQIRHTLLPKLDESVPEASQQLCRIASKASRAYQKILTVADKLFSPLVISRENGLTLDTKKAKVPLTGGMDEIFRLWLDHQGFRFPINTFKGKALLNDVRNLSYRNRFIVKNGHIIRIYEKLTSNCH